MDDDFLLRLYRLARETDKDAFQPAAIGLLRKSLDFQSAFWGEGALQPDSSGATLTSVYFHDFDPEYVAEWQSLNHPGRLIPVGVNAPGRALEVRSAQFYSGEPERAALHEKYRLRSYAFISDFTRDRSRCRWLNLYRSEDDASGAQDDLAWIEGIMPHLGEAWRIHCAIHSMNVNDSSTSDGSFSVVKRHTRGLPRAGEELPITARQREIATLYARGWSYKEVAGAFGLCPATVRNHLAAVYAVLKIHSRRELFRALEAGNSRVPTALQPSE